MNLKKVLLLLLLVISPVSWAETVRLVVPFTAGGIVDRSARALEKTLSARLPLNFLIEYQLGAGGVIASNMVAKNTSKQCCCCTRLQLLQIQLIPTPHMICSKTLCLLLWWDPFLWCW